MTDEQRKRLLPVRVAGGAWQFINPRLKAGRVPYTRTVLVMQIAAAILFIGYSLVKKNVQLPWDKKPYYVTVLLPDAKGLNPAKEPAVGVSGVPVGKVVGAKVQDGHAVIRMRLDHDLKGKIFADASAFVRPTSILQTLIVNITPGDPKSGPLPPNTPIPASRTGTFVSIDQLTGVLDPDTQAQVQILLHETSKALDGREPQIRAILEKLGELTDGVTPLARALAERRKLLSSLTVNMDKLMTTLGQRGNQLADAVKLGSQTLQVTQNRSPELQQAVRTLAPTLVQARQALTASRQLSTTLIPALDRLNPVVSKIKPTADELADLAPELSRFVDRGEALIKVGKTPVAQLAAGLQGQDARVRADQIPALKELGHLSQLLYDYRYGLVETAVNISGATSVARKGNPVSAQIGIVNVESGPGSLGLTAAQAKQKINGRSRMATMLAQALEYSCRDDKSAAACLTRFSVPGMPAQPLIQPLAKGSGG